MLKTQELQGGLAPCDPPPTRALPWTRKGAYRGHLDPQRKNSSEDLIILIPVFLDQYLEKRIHEIIN